MMAELKIYNMKYLLSAFILLTTIQIYAQFQIENYTNAKIDELQTIEQVVNWIHFNQPDQVIPNLYNDHVIDKTYLNIESTSLAPLTDGSRIEYNLLTSGITAMTTIIAPPTYNNGILLFAIKFPVFDIMFGFDIYYWFKYSFS